jgi:hypothetical protein
MRLRRAPWSGCQSQHVPAVQNPCKKSVANHLLASYHRAILAVINSHFQGSSKRARHADAVDAIRQQLDDHNHIRSALVAAVRREGQALRVVRRTRFPSRGVRRGAADSARRPLGVSEVTLVATGAVAAPLEDEPLAQLPALSPSQRERVSRAAKLADVSDARGASARMPAVTGPMPGVDDSGGVAYVREAHAGSDGSGSGDNDNELDSVVSERGKRVPTHHRVRDNAQACCIDDTCSLRTRRS